MNTELVNHPTRFFWTFGNHEPLPMYRRIGRKSTGGVQGGAQWLKKWHNWYDSEESAKLMEELGLNLLHCRCYKGLGWEYEKKDFPNVLRFAENCHKHGVHVLAYIQYGSVYPEIMRREIPNLIDWVALHQNGTPFDYLGDYWRWMPCVNRPGFMDYMDGVIEKIVGCGAFDGVMFDNTMSFPCHCPECRKKLIERLEKRNLDYLYPEFVEMPPEELHGEFLANRTLREVMDPVEQEYLHMRHETTFNAFKHIREVIKGIDPNCIITSNIPVMPRDKSLNYFCTAPMNLTPNNDVTLSQTANAPAFSEPNTVVSQMPDIKLINGLGIKAVPLVDGDAGRDDSTTGNHAPYICQLCESLFNNCTPVDRIVMKPARGGGVDENRIKIRKPLLKRIQQITREFEPLLELPEYAPVGILYDENGLMLSKMSMENYLRCCESLFRSHIPFRVITSRGDYIDEASLKQCDTIILPGTRCLSDAVIEKLNAFPGDLVLAGSENGDYDEFYSQRAIPPFQNRKTRSIKITEHDLSDTGFRIAIHFKQDEWAKEFSNELGIRIHPAAHAVFKMEPSGKVAGVLVSAPVHLPGGTVTLPEKFRSGEYRFVTMHGTFPAVFEGDQIELPAFDGMIMLCSVQYGKE